MIGPQLNLDPFLDPNEMLKEKTSSTKTKLSKKKRKISDDSSFEEDKKLTQVLEENHRDDDGASWMALARSVPDPEVISVISEVVLVGFGSLWVCI
jgi:hypothetical protein